MIVNDPWSHIIVDNFLDEDLYNQIVNDSLESFHYTQTPSGLKKMVGITFDTEGNVLKDNFLSSVLDFETIFTIYENYYPKCLDLLKQIDPMKVDQVKHFDIHVTVCGEDYVTEKIHLDAPEKMLSVVVYLHPKESFGTILFTSPDEDGIITEWKQNRAMAFSREPNTWHNYKSGSDKRLTLLLNLNSGFIK